MIVRLLLVAAIISATLSALASNWLSFMWAAAFAVLAHQFLNLTQDFRQLLGAAKGMHQILQLIKADIEAEESEHANASTQQDGPEATREAA